MWFMLKRPDTLVIGGTGLVGSHLLWLLAQQGPVFASARTIKNQERVRQLFHFCDSKIGEELFKRIEWVTLDILNIEDLAASLKGMRKVYHCAALVSFHRIDFYRCIQINREGTANVVNACLDIPNIRLCYVSSTAAVGQNPVGEIDETCLWKASDTNSGYSVAKFGAEKEVWRGMEEGLNAVIINPCTVIGPGLWEEGSMEMFRVANNGIPFYPSGCNATVDARDVATSMVFLMDSGIQNERFLCTGSNKDFRGLFTAITRAMNEKPPRIYAPKWLAIPVSYFLETISLVRKKRQGMTIESARAAYATRIYNSNKLKKLMPKSFFSLEDSIEHAIKGRIV
jgi:nucleoside-diphosphate-sugar epimerase